MNHAMWLLSLTAVSCMFAESAQPRYSGRKASTVAVDPKSGRLVRTVVVAPRVIEPRVITPVEIGGDAVPVGPDQAISEIVEESARRNGVDPLLVHSVIKTESNYNPKAVSNKGAQGLMQLMPGTARDLGVKNAFDPKDNIEGGVKYLRYLQTQFGDPALALAAYNAGEGAVRRYNWIPPFQETQDYVVKVAQNYRHAREQQRAGGRQGADQVSCLAGGVVGDQGQKYGAGLKETESLALSLPKTSSGNQSALYPKQIPCSCARIPCSIEKIPCSDA